MFVAAATSASVVPVSPLVSIVRRVATRTVDCCLEHERQTSKFALALPASKVSTASTTTGRKSIMEIVHSRCAGIDVSKRDAKVYPGCRTWSP
jgi:hypothetical protein